MAADPFAWMRDSGHPAMREHLAAERADYDEQMAPLAGLRDELLAELRAREPAAEESVRWRQGGYWYFTQTVAGQEYGLLCRSESPDGPAQVLLDENLLAEEPASSGYVAVGVREVSPDGRLLAYSADFDGDEVYQLRVRDLATGTDLPERIERSYYGLAWSADSRSLFYLVTDRKYRPYEVRRHVLGTDPAADAVVYTEDDERFDVTVRATRSGGWVLIEAESRDTTQTLVIPAGEPGRAPVPLAPRVAGVEYRADHGDGPGGGEFYLVTNQGAEEYRLVKTPAPPMAGAGTPGAAGAATPGAAGAATPGAGGAGTPGAGVRGGAARDEGVTGPAGWQEVIAGSVDTRLVSCDVFGDYLVVEQRRGAATQLRILDRRSGRERLVEAGGPEVSLALAVNEDYGATAVTVCTQSLIDPPAWHDVDLATGAWRLRKRKRIPGYDPSGYRTRRLTARAPDGTAIPVTIAYRTPSGAARHPSEPGGHPSLPEPAGRVSRPQPGGHAEADSHTAPEPAGRPSPPQPAGHPTHPEASGYPSHPEPGGLDGTAPCLLYGYGAYESCEWPEFSAATVSLLDRGFVYAVAHVRGGGEGGRRWWLDGRLDRKRNTFTDFIAAADMLAGEGWVAGDRIVSRGLSAGGLLQGAVFSLAPQRWRAVVAEVPFVDCVTTMLDPDIPLTIGEWDEWGDPRDPAARAYLASYSPYDNVPAGPRPDLLVTGSLHDPRVLIHEPAKWVAKLRTTGTGRSRLLFRPDLGAAGHTGPTGRYAKLGYEAEVLAFIVDAAA